MIFPDCRYASFFVVFVLKGERYECNHCEKHFSFFRGMIIMNDCGVGYDERVID